MNGAHGAAGPRLGSRRFAPKFIGIGLGALALFAGFIGIGIGFGRQNIASNFISGPIILFERPVKKDYSIDVLPSRREDGYREFREPAR